MIDFFKYFIKKKKLPLIEYYEDGYNLKTDYKQTHPSKFPLNILGA